MRACVLQATVRAVVADGLVVTFLKFFSGVVDRFHLPQERLATWRTAFTPGMRVKARVLALSPSDKLVRLSMLRNLVDFHLPRDLPLLGAVFSAAVVRADATLGVLVRVPSAPVATHGYVHISNLEAKAGGRVPSNVGREFPPGTELRVKVTGARVMDALVSLTARRAAVDAEEVTWETLEAGAVLSGRVHAVEEYGVMVQVTPAIRGLIPVAHATDAATAKSVHKRYSPGQTVRFRCVHQC
jgi:ribosomal protein S1